MSMLILAFSGNEEQMKRLKLNEIAKFELLNTEKYGDLFFDLLKIVRLDISDGRPDRMSLLYDGYTTVSDVISANSNLKLVMFSSDMFQFNKWKDFLNKLIEKADSEIIFFRFRRGQE